MDKVDVVVVGCGVSGASTAIEAARAGSSVTVFEEHSEVGYPSHCSGHVGIAAFKQFVPNLPAKVIENNIRGAVLHAPGGKSLTLSRPSPVTWVLNRAEFDQHLASTATKSGVDLRLNSRVESVQRSDHGFRVRVNSGQESSDVSCKVLVDAGGCGAPVSRYVGIVPTNRSLLVNSAQFNVEDVQDVDVDYVEVYYCQKYAPGFFGWIIPRRDGSAKVGLAAGLRANVQVCFDRFVKKHPIVSSKLKNAKFVTKPRYHPIPVSGGKNRTYADGFLSVGDAASQVKPTTGGGIVFGLACGRLAGDTASRAAQLEDASAYKMKSYEDAWRRMIGFDLNAMASLRRLLYRLPDQSFDRIFRMSSEMRIDEILSRSSDIDFQGRTLLHLARDPRLFVTLLSMSVISIPSMLRRSD